MTIPAALCPRCGSPLSVLASGAICLSCPSKRLPERSDAQALPPVHATSGNAAAPLANCP